MSPNAVRKIFESELFFVGQSSELKMHTGLTTNKLQATTPTQLIEHRHTDSS